MPTNTIITKALQALILRLSWPQDEDRRRTPRIPTERALDSLWERIVTDIKKGA